MKNAVLNSLLKIKLNLRLNWVYFVFVFCFLLVAFINDGFMGTDEYWNAMVKYLPAQTSTYRDLVDVGDVKSPLQVLPMHLGAQLALNLGITHPYFQYRFTILFLALINTLLYLWSFLRLSKLIEPLNLKVFVLLMSFYFASAFTLTRPMFESLAAPWILLSAVYFLAYQKDEHKRSSLFFATTFASVAFIFRQQTGIGALTIPLILFYKKKWREALWVCLLGLGYFIVSGVPDIFLRGDFHHSLKAVTFYNLDHGHEYGHGSVLFYPVMLLAMSFFPFFLSRNLPREIVLKNLRNHIFSFLFIFLFVCLHSYFPQKFERFLISIIPLVLLIMSSFLTYFVLQYKIFKTRWRVVLILNLFLWFVASFQPAQKNIIELARFIDAHPEYHHYINFEKTIEWIPEKFISHHSPYEFIAKSLADVQGLDFQLPCDTVLVLNDYWWEKNKYQFSHVETLARFEVNLIEKIAYSLNRKNNIRRAPLILLGCKKFF